MEKVNILNDAQKKLAAELAAAYNFKEEEITFFSGDNTPFLSYKATCKMANRLVNLQDIDIMPVPSVSPDSITYKCVLTLADGRTRGMTGVVNLSETIDGAKMSDTQITGLAQARAIRAALQVADIDLLQLHFGYGEVSDANLTSHINVQLRQAHKLGEEKGVIVNGDKTAWYLILWTRYQVSSSKELDADQRADFISFLKSYTPQPTFTGNTGNQQIAA